MTERHPDFLPDDTRPDAPHHRRLVDPHLPRLRTPLGGRAHRRTCRLDRRHDPNLKETASVMHPSLAYLLEFVLFLVVLVIVLHLLGIAV